MGILLAELGDYTSNEHSLANVSEFRFLPDDQQNDEFEEQVLQKWATYKYDRERVSLISKVFSRDSGV